MRLKYKLKSAIARILLVVCILNILSPLLDRQLKRVYASDKVITSENAMFSGIDKKTQPLGTEYDIVTGESTEE